MCQTALCTLWEIYYQSEKHVHWRFLLAHLSYSDHVPSVVRLSSVRTDAGRTDGRRTDGRTDDGRTTDAAPCHKLTWPFGPGELINRSRLLVSKWPTNIYISIYIYIYLGHILLNYRYVHVTYVGQQRPPPFTDHNE